MFRKQQEPDSARPEKSRRKQPEEQTPQEIQEELAFLRQQCNSLQLRGHYAACIKTIEDNLGLLYTKERWPEQFFSLLRLHQKCFPSLRKEQSHQDYTAALLRRNNIPYVIALLLQGTDSSIVWTAEFFRDLALASQSGGDAEAALAYSDLVIKIDPGSSNAYLFKGRILDDMNRGDEAVALYQHALELNGNNRHALNSMARHYLQRSPIKALEYVSKAMESSPGDAKLLGMKAAILKSTGDREGALALLEEAAKIDPYDPAFPYEKAELLLELDRRGSAIPQYRMAISLNNKHVPSLMRLAGFSSEGQPDVALGYLNTVMGLEPQNLDACLLRAALLQRLGDNAAAIQQYKAVLELDPRCHEAMGSLGSLYLLEDAPADACSSLLQAVEAAPNIAQYHLDKARAHQRLEEPDLAVREYKATVALDQTEARAWAELGYLAAHTKPREAVDYFTKAITYAPESAYYHAAKAELLLRLPVDRTAAIESFDKACLCDPGNAELHLKLGRLLEEAGNDASAVEHYKASLSLDPDCAETYFRLARLRLETHPEQALLYINSAIALSVTVGEYYFLKARILTYLGHNLQAVEELRKAAPGEQQPGPEVLSELGQLTQNGSPRVALLYMNRAIELVPDNPAYLCERAHLLFLLGQKGKAMEQYEKLLARSPDQPEALFGIGRILAEKKDPKALEYFSKAIAGAPAVAEYHAEKAAFLGENDATWREAVEAYTAAIQLNTRDWTVILGKARLLDTRGEIGAALTEYRRVLLLYPKALEATARTGILLAERKPDAALIYLDQAVKLDPGQSLHYAWRAKVLGSLDRQEDAARDLSTAVELAGAGAGTYFTLASILGGSLPRAALDFCRLALEGRPGEAGYHLLAGDLHAGLLEYSQARERYAAAAALDTASHLPLEKLAQIAYLDHDPLAATPIDMALASRGDCPVCLALKARVLDEMEGDPASALDCISRAVALDPSHYENRQKLVELLGKRRSLLRLVVEKRKLEKLRRKLEIPLEIPEPPHFAGDETPVLPDPPLNGHPGGEQSHSAPL